MKVNWEHLIHNKYNYLLMTQIAIIICYPILQRFETTFPFISLMLLAAITPALWVGLSRKLFLLVISLGVLALFLNFIFSYRDMTFSDKGALVLLFVYALFYFLAISTLVLKISSNTMVTGDTIKGGISIYFLLGLFWTMLYLIAMEFDPNAISNINPTRDEASFNCFYFSFTTLTTLGYGDIAPISKYAKILAFMEAVTGQVYLAIFVAQLIGLSIAHKMRS